MATTKDRGYGQPHRRERQRVKRMVESGYAICSRCGGILDPTEPFDLDHSDDRESFLGPSHVYCNRRAGGARGGRSTARKRRVRVWSRQWLDD